jgi:hypothetical protein
MEIHNLMPFYFGLIASREQWDARRLCNCPRRAQPIFMRKPGFLSANGKMAAQTGFHPRKARVAPRKPDFVRANREFAPQT